MVGPAAMRLLPVVPFFVANLVPALVGVRFLALCRTTAWESFRRRLVFTSVGAGLGEVFARGETPDLGIIFPPGVLFAFGRGWPRWRRCRR